MFAGDDAIGRSSVQRYSPGVLIGNWYEEMRQKEDKLKLYKLKKAYATSARQDASVNPIAMENLTKRLKQQVNLNQVFQALPQDDQLADEASARAEDEAEELYRGEGPRRNKFSDPSNTHRDAAKVKSRGRRVPLGVPMMLINKKTGAALAIDTTPRKLQDPYEALLTATPSTVPMLRSTWTVFPCPDDNNGAYRSEWMNEPNILHYGQHVRIGNENLSEMGIYYLQSDMTSGHYAMKHQPARVAMGACADNVFVIGRPAHRRGDPTSDGYPVRMGDPIILIHSLTNQPLHCSGEVQSTSFGAEFRVTCHLERQNHHSFSRGAVGVCEENIFTFSIGSEDDGPKTKSQQTTVDISDVLSMSCGDAVECVLGRIRHGAIKFGGRLGLRPFSLALRTAGAEGRYPQFLDRQGLVEHISKLGVFVLPVELDAIMKKFDHSGNNVINTQELMRELRGDINPDRMKAVVTAFQRVLIEGKGGIDFKDMFNLYRENAHGHPDVMDGLISREQACKDFEVCWPSNIINTKLGTVRLDEFVEYYSDISAAVYDDRRFLATLRNCWMIPVTDEYLKGEPFRVITVLHVNDTTETIKIPDTMHLNPDNKDGIRRMLIQHGVKDIKDFRVSNLM